MANISKARPAPKWRDPFEVPAALIPEGMSYQWCAKRADSTGERQGDYEKMLDGGWVLVPRQWIPGGSNMIAGNDLMCRPKFLTDTARLENVEKAARQVDEWAERFGGFSGGVRIQRQMSGGASVVYDLPMGDPKIAARLCDARPGEFIKVDSPEKIVPSMRYEPIPPPAKTRRPRHPALRWLFNLISVED